MKLSDFLTNMVTAGKVKVTAKQLRKFAQQYDDYERIIAFQKNTNEKLMTRIDRLEAKLSLLELEEPPTIDLFA